MGAGGRLEGGGGALQERKSKRGSWGQVREKDRRVCFTTAALLRCNVYICHAIGPFKAYGSEWIVTVVLCNHHDLTSDSKKEALNPSAGIPPRSRSPAAGDHSTPSTSLWFCLFWMWSPVICGLLSLASLIHHVFKTHPCVGSISNGRQVSLE